MVGLFGIVKQTFSEFFDDHCTRLAAALSYYTVFSLPPLLILIMLLLGAVMGPDDVRQLLEGQVGALLGPAGTDAIREILTSAERPDMNRGATAAAGIGALLFGAVGAFVELQNALNRAWEVEPDPQQGGVKRFIAQRILSFGMLLTIAFLLLVALVVSTLLAMFGDVLGRILPDPFSGALLHVINIATSLAVITLLFALLFRFVPDARIAWRDALIGALVTATLFTIGKYVLGLYLAGSEPGSAFGAAGSLAVLLLWIYYSAIILLLGAEFTQVRASHRGAGIRPDEGAVRMSG